MPTFLSPKGLKDIKGLSSLLLLSLASTANPTAQATTIASSARFISAVGKYISHQDPSIRRCGLLVAEIITEMSGNPLRFGGWDGVGEGRDWARSLRAAMKEPETTIEEVHGESSVSNDEDTLNSRITEDTTLSNRTMNYDSDDSLEGYISDKSIEIGPSEQELEEMEKDASLRGAQGSRPIRPVYIVQLLQLLQPVAKNESNTEAEKQDIGLNASEELIRRKRGFGTELGA
jgi:telomere length regulation protein